MNRGERKDKLRAIRDAQDRAAARARVRHPHEDISYRGVGLRRVQILRAPSFMATVAWEVREADGRFALYRSHSPEPEQYLLVDHLRFDAASEDLQRLIDPLRALSLPLCPDLEAFAVADGTRIEVALDVGATAEVRLAWSEGHAPAAWEEMERLTRALLTFFETTAAAEPAFTQARP